MTSHITMTEIIVLVIKKIKSSLFEALQTSCLPITLKRVKRCYLRGFDHYDLIQEAHLLMWKIVQHYDIARIRWFRPYYHFCLNNHFNTLIRDQLTDKRSLNQQVSSLNSLYERIGVELDHGNYADAQPEAQAIARETLARYLTGLSTFEEHVFQLLQRNYTYKQIAKELDAREMQVRDASYRCRKKLKKIVYKR